MFKLYHYLDYLQEHLRPEFLKMNPHHTIPVLKDGDFVLYESRAICIYLIEKYGKNDSLYPKNPKQRAVVNQRLYFDMGTLFKSFSEFYYPQVLQKMPANPDKLKLFMNALDLLEKFLENNDFVACSTKITLADISIVATINTCELSGYNFNKHPNIHRWYGQMKKNLNWSANLKAAAHMKHYNTKISYE